MIPVLRVKIKKNYFDAIKEEASVINNKVENGKIIYPEVIKRS